MAIPHISKPLPRLHSITIGIIQLGAQFKPIFALFWAQRFIDAIPAAPSVETVTLMFYVQEPGNLPEIMKDGIFTVTSTDGSAPPLKFGWTDFTKRVLPSKFPALKKIVLHLAMETEFGTAERKRLEKLVGQCIPGLGSSVVILWGVYFRAVLLVLVTDSGIRGLEPPGERQKRW